MKKKHSPLISDCRGVSTAMTVILMAVFVGALAIVIDLGHLHTVQSELRNAADSGALAGARALFPQQLGADVTEDVYPDCAAATAAAEAAVQANLVDKTGVQIAQGPDIQVGHWDLVTRTFTPGGTGCSGTGALDPNTMANAVRVVTRKDDTQNNPVLMTFARFLNQDWVSVTAEAIGYIGWASGFNENQCVLPIGIPLCSGVITGVEGPDVERCPTPLRFASDNTDRTVWHTFDYHNASADLLKCLLTKCTASPSLNCPLSQDGNLDQVEVNNGNINSVLQQVWDLFINVLKHYNDPDYANKFVWTSDGKPGWMTQIILLKCEDQDGNPITSYTDWKAVQRLPVYDEACLIVTDVRAAGRPGDTGETGKITIDEKEYDFTWATRDRLNPDGSQIGSGYIDGCVVGKNKCVGNNPPGGIGGVRTQLPVLVK